MAVGAYSWSTTAASNGSADANINFAEGQSPPSLNNSARAMMAALAALWSANGGGITYGGSSNAYTATNNAVGVWAAYATGQVIGFVPNGTNSGAATLNVDGLGAKSIVKGASTAVASGDLVQNVWYLLRYDGTNFQIVGGVTSTSLGATYQPLDATLTALAALSTSASQYIRATGTDTFTMDSYATVLSNIGAMSSAGGAMSGKLTASVAGQAIAANNSSSGGFNYEYQNGGSAVAFTGVASGVWKVYDSNPTARLTLNLTTGALVVGSVQAPVATSSETSGTLSAVSANAHLALSGNVTLNNSVFAAGDKMTFDPGTSNRTFTRGSGVTMYLNGVDSATATLAANQMGGAHWRSASVVALTGAFS